MTMKQTNIVIMTILVVLALGLLAVLLIQPIKARASLLLLLPGAAHTDHTINRAPATTTVKALKK